VNKLDRAVLKHLAENLGSIERCRELAGVRKICAGKTCSAAGQEMPALGRWSKGA
jgi:hypothetical protein